MTAEREQLRLIFWSVLLTAHIFTAEQSVSVSGMDPAENSHDADAERWRLVSKLLFLHSSLTKMPYWSRMLSPGLLFEVKMFTLTGFE